MLQAACTQHYATRQIHIFAVTAGAIAAEAEILKDKKYEKTWDTQGVALFYIIYGMFLPLHELLLLCSQLLFACMSYYIFISDFNHEMNYNEAQ